MSTNDLAQCAKHVPIFEHRFGSVTVRFRPNKDEREALAELSKNVKQSIDNTQAKEPVQLELGGPTCHPSYSQRCCLFVFADEELQKAVFKFGADDIVASLPITLDDTLCFLHKLRAYLRSGMAELEKDDATCAAARTTRYTGVPVSSLASL